MWGRYFNIITTGIRTVKQKPEQRCQEFRRQAQVRGMSSIGRHSDASADSLSSRCTIHSQHCGEQAWTNNNLGDGCRGREMPAPKESCQGCNQDLDTVLQADTEALSHQIAGHSLGQTALLKHRLGYVLKLVQKPPMGQREVDFYRRVYENSSELDVHIQLRALIPKFYGVTNIEIVEEGNSPSMKQYLILEDICQGFKHPCVVDVKIGVKTWDPLAPKAKIDHESSKYVGTKGPLGISVTGMQLYDITEKSTIKRDKEFGKHLNVDNVHQAFAEFLNTQAGVHTFLARKLLEQLEQIHNVLACQKEYAFYSSSLLIAYDASKAETLVTNEQYDDCNERHVSTDVIRVKMIDFAHAFPNNGKLDENYIFGLNNLMQIIRTIAKCYN